MLPRVMVICVSILLISSAGMHAADQPASRSLGLSLEDCIELALKNNLDVQLQRYRPEIDQYALSGSYAAYDPALRFRGENGFRTSEQGTTVAQFDPPPNETDRRSFSTGIGGLLPTGFEYDLSAGLNRSSSLVFANGQAIDTGFDYSSNVGITMSQPLLKNFWIDNPRFQIKLNRKNLYISEQVLRQQIMDTVTQVQLAYFDLIAAQENVLVQERALELAEQLLSDNRKRVQVGQMAPLDVQQAESEVAARRADLISTQNVADIRQNDLKNLLTANFPSWQDIMIQPTEKLEAIGEAFNRVDSWQKGLTLRPEILQSQLELEKQDVAMKFNHNQLFPQLDLIGSFGYSGRAVDSSGAYEDIEVQRNPNYSFGVQISIPLGNLRARKDYQIAKTQKEQLLVQHKRLEQNIMVEIDNDIKQAQTSFQRVEATREAREFAEAALEAEQKKLANGKSTSFEVLRFQRDLTERRSAEISALADYNKALAELARSEGYTLKRRGIELEVQE